MDERSKQRKQKIAIIHNRINELKRAFPYIGYTDYYYTRLQSLTAQLNELKYEVRREDNINLSSDDRIEQYIITYE